MVINHESDVTELLANTVEEHLHVLLKCSPCESQDPSTINLQNYVKVMKVSSSFNSSDCSNCGLLACDTTQHYR